MSDVAPGPLSLGNPDPFWSGKRGQTAQGGYLDPGRAAQAVCFRWHANAEPGRWIVSVWAGMFFHHFNAVTDDFGTLVGVPS